MILHRQLVKAIGRYCFSWWGLLTLGSGFIIAVFHKVGVVLAVMDELNNFVMMGASWYEHSFRIFGISPSGPAPFLGFRYLSCFSTLSSDISKAGAVCRTVLSGVLLGVLLTGFSNRVKKVFSSSGVKLFLAGAVVETQLFSVIFPRWKNRDIWLWFL